MTVPAKAEGGTAPVPLAAANCCICAGVSGLAKLAPWAATAAAATLRCALNNCE